MEIGWAKIAENSPYIHKILMETAVRNITGVSVVGIIRKGIFAPNPKADYRFTPGDLVAVVGSKQERDFFQQLAEKESI